MSYVSFRPFRHGLAQAFGVTAPELESVAVDRWQIAPAERCYVLPATFLAGQLDRIRGTEFGSVKTVVQDFVGGFDAMQGETLGFRLRHVDLVDGVLYAQGASRHLRQRERRRPAYRIPTEAASGALYETWVGNRWFGNWLSDDCLTYRLAERFGTPVTTAITKGAHMPDYEARLGIRPHRVQRVHFDELIIFRNSGHNTDRLARGDDLRARLIAGAEVEDSLRRLSAARPDWRAKGPRQRTGSCRAAGGQAGV